MRWSIKRFFLSTEFDFKTKKWISGGKIIPSHAWAKSKQHELPFPVLNDQIMFLHNKYYWHNREKWESNTLKKDLFRIVIFSSNEYHLKERPGFYICENGTGPELLLSKSQLFSKYKPDQVCEKGFTIFVPKTETDFVQVMKTIDTTNLSNPFRLGSNWEVVLLLTKHCSLQSVANKKFLNLWWKTLDGLRKTESNAFLEWNRKSLVVK